MATLLIWAVDYYKTHNFLLFFIHSSIKVSSTQAEPSQLMVVHYGYFFLYLFLLGSKRNHCRRKVNYLIISFLSSNL